MQQLDSSVCFSRRGHRNTGDEKARQVREASVPNQVTVHWLTACPLADSLRVGPCSGASDSVDSRLVVDVLHDPLLLHRQDGVADWVRREVKDNS